MSDASNQQVASNGSIIATGVTATALGGALATILAFYYHTKGVQFTPEVEDACQTIFTTGVTALSMVGHLIIEKLLNSK